jgi:AbrB family looped-hinge helix DNA binding protein
MTEKVTIDKFGRILIPKKLRERFRLEPNQSLDVQVSDEGMTLRPNSNGEIVLQNGMYVWTGSTPTESWEEITESLREERVDNILRNI